MTSRKAVIASEAEQSRRTWGRGDGSDVRFVAARLRRASFVCPVASDDDSANPQDELTPKDTKADGHATRRPAPSRSFGGAGT